MISLVDPSDLENVLRPTVYQPVVTTPSAERGGSSPLAVQRPALLVMTSKKVAHVEPRIHDVVEQ